MSEDDVKRLIQMRNTQGKLFCSKLYKESAGRNDLPKDEEYGESDSLNPNDAQSGFTG